MTTAPEATSPRNPGFGPLCPECGTAPEAPDHRRWCSGLRARPGRWAEGWVDLNAFGLPAELAEGWPEVWQGPILRLRNGWFGPELLEREGPWVRHPDPSCPTHRRVGALAVLLAGGDAPADALAAVLAADGPTVEAWCRPEHMAIDTTGCDKDHQVTIVRGVAVAVNHRHSASHRVDPTIRRFRTSATCSYVVQRWERAEVGSLVGDLTSGPVPTYTREGGNPAVNEAMEPLRLACLVRARSDLIDAGEPDRWLHLDAVVAPIGEPATLRESTRPIPVALVAAPPSWPWSPEPLG